MDPVNQEVRPDETLTGIDTRKRGRPRKDPGEKRAQRARSHADVCPPPGFAPLPNRTPPVDPINDPTQVMVGQTVTGVVQGTFDAGYLLAVRIGNSNITLTGAVFKPGQAAPLTPENDVAPHVEMIKRTEIPIPTEVQPPKHRRKRRSKEKSMQLVTYGENGSDAVDMNPPPKSNRVLPPSAEVSGKATFVPVVLRPINPSNSLSNNQPAPHLRASLGKRVHSVLPLAVYPPNVSASKPADSQSSSQFTVTPPGFGNENAPFKNAEGSKTVKSSNVQDGVVKTESDIGDMNEPLFVEPLQTRHTVPHFQPPPVFGGGMHNATGRMTELLQAVQQNTGDDQARRM